MPQKRIPFQVKEFLQNQIVEGSAGYEPMLRILRNNHEDDIRWFLEYYESSIRDGLLEEGKGQVMEDDELKACALQVGKAEAAREKIDPKNDLFSRNLKKMAKGSDEDKDNLSNLFKSLAPLEDD